SDSRRTSTTSSIFGVGDEAIYQRFKTIARRAGVEAHPHQLRHTFATNMLSRGMSPLALQTLGGWANQAMVKRYAKAALADAAIEEMRRLE
ncbi:MAG: site-specific integrase, partial [Gemmatimonadaceae bacterium]|nr:site-specific integrase [Gemmatimonadaceae bacterium]